MTAPQPQTTAPSPLHSLNPKHSLLSLPKEIISAIVLHLDRSDALSLTYTARCFAALTEIPLWRDLDLSINPWYGQRPRITEHPPGTDEYDDEENAAGAEGDALYATRLRERLKGMMAMADARRWKMTEGVRIVDRPGGSYLLRSILDCISYSIQRLQFEANPKFMEGRLKPLRCREQLEYGMITSLDRIDFPSLTHIHIGPRSIDDFGLVILLCSSAPNLVSLLANLDGTSTFADEKISDHSRIHERDTKLQSLQLAMASPVDCIPALIDYSPLLERVSIRGAGIYRYLVETLDSLLGCQHLQALLCDISLLCYQDEVDYEVKAGTECAALRTLVLNLEGWQDLLTALPEAPQLRTLLLRCPPTSFGIAGATEPSPQCPVQGMIPTFAEALRESPELRLIRRVTLDELPAIIEPDVFSVLDQPQYAGTVIGSVQSISHKGSDLLHARLLLDRRERLDELSPAQSELDAHDPNSYLVYEASDGVIRVKYYEQLSNAVWQDFTDYNDHPVPLAVIQRMREVEGVKEAEWEARGVEVGEAAWKVLTDWEDQLAGAIMRRE